VVLVTILYQALTADFESRSTNSLSVDLSLDLTQDNITNLDGGGEINFWIKDQFVDVHSFEFAVLTGDLSFYIEMDASNQVSLSTLYGGTNMSTVLYTDTTHRWINIEVLTIADTLLDIMAWDYGNFSLEPKLRHKYDTIGPFTNNHLLFRQTGNTEGIYFAEVRAFKYQATFSNGVYYRYYDIIGSIPSNMIKYARVSNSSFYLNAHHTTPASVNISGDQAAFEVNICQTGYKISSTVGTCNACQQSGCIYCEVVDSAYSDLCRNCNENITSCVTSEVCPLDFYNYNGICLRCPVGCSECISDTECTYCDSGLVLVTDSITGATTCDCPSGEFETNNTVTDVMSCTACTSPCNECHISGTNCTSCTGIYYYANNTCLSDCGLRFYEDTTTQTCESCPSNCLNCTDSNTCTV
jgi:hypothetical protein